MTARRTRRDARSEAPEPGAQAEPGLRARKKQQVRGRILAVCGRLFREQGFDETTVDAIAAAAEVSRQTFFNYFTSKETVLGELGLDWLRQQAEHAWRGQDAMAARSPFGVIRIGVRSQLEAIERDPGFMRLVFTRSGLIFPHGAHVGTDADTRRLASTRVLFDATAGLMRRGQEAGAIRTDLPAEQAAEIYVSAMLVMVRLWLTGYWGDTGGLVERGLRAIDVLEDGLRARAAARPARTRATRPAEARRAAKRAAKKRAANKRAGKKRAGKKRAGEKPPEKKRPAKKRPTKKRAAKRRPARPSRGGARSPR